MKRVIAGAVIAAGAILPLAACGQSSPPTPSEVQQNLQYFQLPGVLTPGGQPVECVMYDSGTHNTNQSMSWFSFTCDFEGKAQFPAPSPSQS